MMHEPVAEHTAFWTETMEVIHREWAKFALHHVLIRLNQSIMLLAYPICNQSQKPFWCPGRKPTAMITFTWKSWLLCKADIEDGLWNAVCIRAVCFSRRQGHSIYVLLTEIASRCNHCVTVHL